MITLLLLLPLAAQGGGDYSALFEEHGSLGASLGSAAARIGDLDGDGIPDFALGAPGEGHPTFWGPPGAVHVYSGATMDILTSFVGTHSNQGFGASLAGPGDVNADGVPDILIGCSSLNYSGDAFVYSGADYSLLYHFVGTTQWPGFGDAVSGIDDIDQDGYADFLVGVTSFSPPGLDRTGAVFAYSGKTGLELYRLDGLLYGERFGSVLSVTEDQDGDGIRDFLVGAPFADPWAPQRPRSAGELRAYSGATGQELFRIPGFRKGGAFGGTISASGDLNGDGVPDIAVGAGNESGPSGQYGDGAAYLFSGADLSLLRRLPAEQTGGAFGSRVQITPDLNGDGQDDLLVSEVYHEHDGLYQAGSVLLFAGQSGRLLKRWDGAHFKGYFGSAIAILGDLDSDGYPEWLIGSSGILSQETYGAYDGGVLAYTFDPLLHANVTEISGSTGGVMSLHLDFPASEAQTAYRILISTTGIGPTTFLGTQLPLTRDDVFRRTLLGEAPSRLQGANGILDASGDAMATFTVPPNVPAAVLNTTRWFAAMTYDDIGPRVRMVTIPIPLEILP